MTCCAAGDHRAQHLPASVMPVLTASPFCHRLPCASRPTLTKPAVSWATATPHAAPSAPSAAVPVVLGPARPRPGGVWLRAAPVRTGPCACAPAHPGVAPEVEGSARSCGGERPDGDGHGPGWARASSAAVLGRSQAFPVWEALWEAPVLEPRGEAARPADEAGEGLRQLGWAGPGRAGPDAFCALGAGVVHARKELYFCPQLARLLPGGCGAASPSPAGMFWEPRHSLAMARVVSRRGGVPRSAPEQALAWRALPGHSQALLLSLPGTPALFEHCCQCSAVPAACSTVKRSRCPALLCCCCMYLFSREKVSCISFVSSLVLESWSIDLEYNNTFCFSFTAMLQAL